MEVILDDFKRTIEVTGDEEAQSVREFTELKRSAEISQQTKESDKEAKDTELGELTSQQEAFDKALTELLELQPACIDTGMSYEDRVAKREQEIDSLNQAMCILDKEGPVKG